MRHCYSLTWVSSRLDFYFPFTDGCSMIFNPKIILCCQNNGERRRKSLIFFFKLLVCTQEKLQVTGPFPTSALWSYSEPNFTGFIALNISY